MNDDERKARYVEIIGKTGRSRPNNMAAFFQATFDVWKDYKRSGKEKYWVDYSPIIGVDGDKILNDLPNAHVLRALSRGARRDPPAHVPVPRDVRIQEFHLASLGAVPKPKTLTASRVRG